MICDVTCIIIIKIQGGQGSLVTEAGGGGGWGSKKEWRVRKMTFLCISSSLQSTCELSFGYLLCPLKDLPIVASFSLLFFKCQCFQMYLSVLNIHQILLRRKKKKSPNSFDQSLQREINYSQPFPFIAMSKYNTLALIICCANTLANSLCYIRI